MGTSIDGAALLPEEIPVKVNSLYMIDFLNNISIRFIYNTGTGPLLPSLYRSRMNNQNHRRIKDKQQRPEELYYCRTVLFLSGAICLPQLLRKKELYH